MSGGLETEADVIRTLDDGTYTIPELYQLIGARADIARDRGLEPPDAEHPTDRVWRRRVRGLLQTLRNTGNAQRVSASVWALRGTRQHPNQLVLIARGGTLQQIELLLKDAVALLCELQEPADLVLCDPPYGLNRGTSGSSANRNYRRNSSQVVPGYVDVPAEEYREFTFGWVAAAAQALRPAGQLVAITGPQQAAIVQYAAEENGLEWVNSIPAFKEFALRSTRRFACSHWKVTVMCRGRQQDRRRVFNTPVDLPKARSGVDYPLDWWTENGRADRPGLRRYDNSLPLRLILRAIEACSNRGELVVDPCVGSGTTLIAARRLARRFIGGDTNPQALRFAAARLLAEHAWREENEPPMFSELAA
jgi:DNA modification methylase